MTENNQLSDEEYDAAIAAMAEEPLDVDEQAHFDELRQYDTNQAKAKRQAERRKRLKDAAKIAGFTSIDMMANAIISGAAKVIKL